MDPESVCCGSRVEVCKREAASYLFLFETLQDTLPLLLMAKEISTGVERRVVRERETVWRTDDRDGERANEWGEGRTRIYRA